MISSDELIQVINQNMDASADKTESHKILDTLSQRVDSIPLFYEVIQKCPSSLRHLFSCFESLRRIVEKRGCLMLPDQLCQHYDFIFHYITENVPYLVANSSVLGATADAGAIVFRHLFERQEFDRVRQILDQLSDFMDASPETAIIVLSFFKSFIEVIDKNFYHMDEFKARNMRNGFKSDYIAQFISIGMKAVSFRIESADQAAIKIDINMKIKGLQLILACFKFADDAKSNKLQSIAYPVSFREIYDSVEAIEAIFGLFEINDSALQTEIFRVFDYFFRASDTVWTSADTRNAFLACVNERIRPIMEAITPDSDFLNEATRTVAIICDAIKGDNRPIDESWIAFADVIGAYTGNVVLSTKSDNFTNLLGIWHKMSFWNIPQEVIENFAQLFFNALQTLVDATFQLAENDSDDMAERLRTMPVSDLSPMWETAKYCFPAFGEMIEAKFGEKIDQAVSECTPAVILQLQFIIKIIDAEPEGKKILTRKGGIDFDDVEKKLIQKMAAFVSSTIEHTADFAQNIGIPVIDLEMAFVHYANNYYALNIANLENIDKQNGVLDPTQQVHLSVIQLYLTRLMADLELFNNVPECGPLMISILDLLEKIAKNRISKSFLAENEIIVSLYTRSVSIDFTEIDPESFGEARTRLYALYASIAPDRKDFLQFLSQFDERFTALAENTTEDLSKDAFALYRDLIGVIDGIKKQQKYQEIFIKWFADGHIDEIVTTIGQYSSSVEVVSAITDLWKSIYRKDENNALWCFPHYLRGTGVGIEMFRSTSAIVNAIYENCEENSDLIPFLAKIIDESFRSETANFGVMRHYGDNSFGEVLDNFFEIIKISYNEIALNEDLCLDIINTLIFLTKECADELFTEQNTENRHNIIKFTQNCFASLDEERSKSTWDKSWQIVKYLFTKTIEKVPGEIELYRPHFVFVLDAIINANVTYTFNSTNLISMMAAADSAFAGAAFQALVESYDPQFQGPVGSALQTLSTAQNNMAVVATFHNTMKSYPASLVFNEFFAPFYQLE